jgi:membrane protease YdiL (CAAX protease family)
MNDEEIRKNRALGVYCIYILIMLSIYNLLIEVLAVLGSSADDTVYVTSVALLVFLGLFITMIKNTGYPLKTFGFNTRNWFKYILEAIGFSLLFCAFMTLIKWYMIVKLPLFSEFTLFRHDEVGIEKLALLTLAYALFTPIQAFMMHGATQAPLLEFLPTPNRKPLSVLVSSLLFSAVHVEFNIVFALFVFIPGLCWALMFLRQRSLIGVSVSHAIIGAYAFAALDMITLFNKVHHYYFPHSLM